MIQENETAMIYNPKLTKKLMLKDTQDPQNLPTIRVEKYLTF